MTEKETLNLELAGWGSWELDSKINEIRFCGEDGRYQRFYNHPLLQLGLFIERWENTETGVMLVFDHYGSQLYRLSGKSGDIWEGTMLNRKEDMDYGLMSSQFKEYDGILLLIYESGIICFDMEANLLWEKNHHKYDWQFSKVADGLVWFKSEYRGEWAYDLNNGKLQTPT